MPLRPIYDVRNDPKANKYSSDVMALVQSFEVMMGMAPKLRAPLYRYVVAIDPCVKKHVDDRALAVANVEQGDRERGLSELVPRINCCARIEQQSCQIGVPPQSSPAQRASAVAVLRGRQLRHVGGRVHLRLLMPLFALFPANKSFAATTALTQALSLSFAVAVACALALAGAVDGGVGVLVLGFGPIGVIVINIRPLVRLFI